MVERLVRAFLAGLAVQGQLVRRGGRGPARAPWWSPSSPVLQVRGLVVPDAARERILAQKDPSLLERWLAKAIVAASVGEVIDVAS